MKVLLASGAGALAGLAALPVLAHEGAAHAHFSGWPVVLAIVIAGVAAAPWLAHRFFARPKTLVISDQRVARLARSTRAS